MKWLVYLAAAVAVCLAPVERMDIGMLQPVEAISVAYDGTLVHIKTDTEDYGVGETIQAAVENLRDTTAGLLYLDTAEYVLVQEGAEQWMPELAGYVKESVRICRAVDVEDLTGASVYLDAHGKGLGNGDVLEQNGDRFILKENRKKMKKVLDK